MHKISGKYKDISRVDQDEKCTYGWYVRVRFKGKTFAKFFSDRKNGNRASALCAAISWRNFVEEKIGKPRTDMHIVTKSSSVTGTGIVGVRHSEKRNRYEVSWVNPQGKQEKTSVSIRKHGKAKAFKVACKVREKKEKERLR